MLVILDITNITYIRAQEETVLWADSFHVPAAKEDIPIRTWEGPTIKRKVSSECSPVWEAAFRDQAAIKGTAAIPTRDIRIRIMGDRDIRIRITGDRGIRTRTTEARDTRISSTGIRGIFSRIHRHRPGRRSARNAEHRCRPDQSSASRAEKK